MEFRNELTACLALVVPVGMTEDGRREWLSVAWATVGHLPADLLSIGCQKAREIADHPSKIVPAIMGEVADMLERRRTFERAYGDYMPSLPPPAEEFDPCTSEEAQAILKEFGLASRFPSNRAE